MIIVTGAAGFIGSYLSGLLNQKGIENLLLVDDFSFAEKNKNLDGKKFVDQIERSEFLSWLEKHPREIDFIFHIGARTDTTEFDQAIFDELNLNYSKAIWKVCTEHQIPLVYASSAATYGLGERGYDDKHEIVEQLEPLNPYGESKNEFDKWVLKQKDQPPFWVGLKFFNVYGPNEYHKGRMASVIFHAFNQISASGEMKLFQSHHPDYKDGEQERDFIYVKDLAKVCLWMMEHQPQSGLYNLGTGKARTFYDLAKSTFIAMEQKVNISYIPTPVDIRDKYQYFTQANMDKLRKAGYQEPFTSLEDGIMDYVSNYLAENAFY